MRRPLRDRERRGIPLRAVVPNAVTALALCSGLSGIYFAIGERWELSMVMIVVAAILDGMDGRIARMLNGQSRFGAELDSLSDVIAFGVSPAMILYLWVLQFWPRIGWMFALGYAVCCALRLARFNANIDVEDQPHKSAGFLTGVPAPAAAGMVLLPVYVWLASEQQWSAVRDFYIVAPWAALIAFLMISSVATFSWTSLRLRRHVRLGAILVIALVGAALVAAPFYTLSIATVIYVALIPISISSYAKVKRQRAAAAAREPLPDAGAAPL